MVKIILTRTGDSNWYIKNTNLNGTPEKAAEWVKYLKCKDNEIDLFS